MNLKCDVKHVSQHWVSYAIDNDEYYGSFSGSCRSDCANVVNFNRTTEESELQHWSNHSSTFILLFYKVDTRASTSLLTSPIHMDFLNTRVPHLRVTIVGHVYWTMQADRSDAVQCFYGFCFPVNFDVNKSRLQLRYSFFSCCLFLCWNMFEDWHLILRCFRK